MTSKKTTAAAILAALAIIFIQIGYLIDNDPATVLDFSRIVEALGLLGIGWFARDNDTSSEQAGAK